MIMNRRSPTVETYANVRLGRVNGTEGELKLMPDRGKLVWVGSGISVIADFSGYSILHPMTIEFCSISSLDSRKF